MARFFDPTVFSETRIHEVRSGGPFRSPVTSLMLTTFTFAMAPPPFAQRM